MTLRPINQSRMTNLNQNTKLFDRTLRRAFDVLCPSSQIPYFYQFLGVESSSDIIMRSDPHLPLDGRQ